MAKNKETDPYAPPPMYHDRSGSVVRIALVAAMLGAGALGYVWYSGQPQTALVPEVVEEQQMADAGYSTAPQTLPEATTESLPAPAPAAAPAPQRRSAPVERSPEPTPEPTPAPPPATQPVPVAPTPIPPVDVPPVGTTG